MTTKEIKIAKLKGRPMLHWVGKKPLDIVKPYPTQLNAQYGFAKDDDTDTPLHFKNLAQDWHHLLLHGDNKEILSSLLCKGFRGKIDLIYIDPPFDSAADYVRKVELRGLSGKVEGEGQNVIEQTQYTDIWQNDTYLQFMYERLILLRELLSEQGSLYLHCDWHKSHHLRFLLDEVFGEENFVNEIIWHYKRWTAPSNSFQAMHDMIFWYSKNKKERIYNKIWVTPANEIKGRKENYQLDEEGRKFRWQTANGERYKIYRNEKGVEADDVWDISFLHPSDSNRTPYPTQKPEALLERIIKASSNPDSIVLDCFAGSGTLAAVAQKLGRKWIASDINKGAIQTTAKRLQDIIKTQNGDVEGQANIKKFRQYHVNNYDFQTRNQAMQIITQQYGIEKLKTESFFDGTVKDALVKIIDLNRPCNMLDIQAVKTELETRLEETRNIRLIASGVEVTVETELEKYNKTHPINKITISNIQKDGVILFEPAEADIAITRDGNNAKIHIKNYFSPTIMKRLDIDKTLFNEHITDFRSQIDYVQIDNNYNGKIFNIDKSDIPEKKKDFIKAEYNITTPSANSKIAIKITDMLGEETLFIDEGEG